MKELDAASAKLLEFVRGECRLNDSHLLGISVDFERWSLYEAASTQTGPILVTPRDIIRGFRSYLDDPEELRRWAFVVLNATNSIELDPAFESTEEGELLLGALWDASFGEPVSPSIPNVIGELD